MFSDYREDFAAVASQYSPMLFRVAFRRLRNVEDAEDAVQDALLSAYRHIGQFEGRSKMSSWLTRIVINAAGMKLRNRPRHQAASLDQAPEDGGATFANQLVDAKPTPETACAQKEMEEQLGGALGRLSPKLRSAFEMREIAGFSAAETACALGVSKGTLKSRISRARVAVRSYIQQERRTRLTGKSRAPAMNRRADSLRTVSLRGHRSRAGKLGARPRGLPMTFRRVVSHGASGPQ
jgi:RNA polymerase sigma-70 factor (ECF subfamily)